MSENKKTFRADGREYTLLRLIGRGANTSAYLAECRYDGLASKCILKEYTPHGSDAFEAGKARFIASGMVQNEIRQRAALNNQTPPVSRIFEANGTAYIDVACFNGTTLDRLDGLSLPQYMEICRTVAKTVGYYHRANYLCLDLKPENIFVMRNAPDDTITQLVEFIDFDSICDMARADNRLFSCTREWAAPEQLAPCAAGGIGKAADIYTVGEIIFFILFGRHSTENEHRGFSKYPFGQCSKEYRKYTERPDVQSAFGSIFRGTLRSSAGNRFGSADEIVLLLDRLLAELDKKDYIVPGLPCVSPDFVGRESELKAVSESLKKNRVLIVTGIGGIGKSTLVRNYIVRRKTDYDAIVYLEYDGDFRHTFCDDMQLQISTASQRDGEPIDEYFPRKLNSLKRICAEKKVLFVLDNYSGLITKDLSRVTDCGYDTIIVTRSKPPKNSFAFMEIGAISDNADIFRLIALNLERLPTREERACFEEIIRLVHGHTLVTELITRQIAAGRLNVRTALELIRENGFSRFSEERIGSFKDGEEAYDTLSAILTALFDASGISEEERLAMKVLSLLDVRGLEADLTAQFFPFIREETIKELAYRGWLYAGDKIKVHPVTAEAVQHWEWRTDDISVMKCHQKMIDIYVGMSNVVHIREILREAKAYGEKHPRHIINAMCYDMLGRLYDTQLNGAYYPENEKEAELLDKLLDSEYHAIAELELSDDPHKDEFLVKYYLDLSSILIRSYPDSYGDAAELLDKINMLTDRTEPEYSENRCYYCMISAWYYTLAEPDIAKTKAFADKAEHIAERVFKTDLEIIDIIHIPTANCFYYHDEYRLAAERLEKTAELCKRHFDSIPYIDKYAELLCCLIDVYLALDDKARCRELAAEVDNINDTYREQGIFREIRSEQRDMMK